LLHILLPCCLQEAIAREAEQRKAGNQTDPFAAPVRPRLEVSSSVLPGHVTTISQYRTARWQQMHVGPIALFTHAMRMHQ
jgi:hypothetical protein